MNVVEVNKDSKKEKKTQSGSKLGPKGGISKKPKFNGKCYNCNKEGHKSSECRMPRKLKPKEAHVVEEIARDVSDINLCAVISEVNLID